MLLMVMVLKKKILLVVDKIDIRVSDGMVLCKDKENKRDYNKNQMNIFPVINMKNADRIISFFNQKISDLTNKKVEIITKLGATPSPDNNTVVVNDSPSSDAYLTAIINSQMTVEDKVKKVKEHFNIK
jgi:hypothetical protein